MAKKTIKRRKWSRCIGRIIDYWNRNYRHWWSDLCSTARTTAKSTQASIRGYQKRNKRLLKDQFGGVTSIEFLIYFTLFVFIIFAGVDYYTTEVQYSFMEDTNEHYLSQMRFQGEITDTQIALIQDELENRGFKEVQVNAYNAYNNVVYRDTGNPANSILRLEISAKPVNTPFIFGRLLGSAEDGEVVYTVKGRGLSEKPEPWN